MIKKLFPLATLVLLTVACTDNIDLTFDGLRMLAQTGQDGAVFYATIEGSADSTATKVYADDQLRVLWNADDRITVFNKYSYGYEYSFSGEDGDNAGEFTAVPNNSLVTGNRLTHVYALYPHKSATKISNDGVITATLPAIQTYKENSFGIGANTMVSVTDDNKLMFRNVGGYLSFKLYGDNVSVKSITLKGNNHEKLAGSANVTMPVKGTPTTIMQDDATESITLTCETPVALGADADHYTEFWFVIPPTTFTNGFTVTVTDALGGVFTKSTSLPLSINRNSISRMATLEIVPDYGFVSFEDANFSAYCLEFFDKNDDGKISIDEALDVEEINVCTDDILSLGGIQSFPNLKTLTCMGSSTGTGRLASLDVSNNRELKSLFCYYNQLTRLDISNNLKLNDLGCSGNLLSSLDVSKNEALSTLWCQDNQLKSLDISHNKSLCILSCENNQLQSLNLSNNDKLIGVTCGNNQITSLDISNNPELTDFWCNSLPLAYLDVTNNPKLVYLNCRGIASSSEIWLLAHQTIENLWFDPEVTTLMYEVPVPDANFRDHCIDFYDANRDLRFSTTEAERVTSLNLCTDDIESLAGIEFFTNLTSLSCTGSGSRKGKLTALDLSSNINLGWIDCSSNLISRLNLSSLIRLEKLVCDDNQLETLDLIDCSGLETLSCDDNQLTSIDVSFCPYLKFLYYFGNPLSEIRVREGSPITAGNINIVEVTPSPEMTQSILRYSINNLYDEIKQSFLFYDFSLNDTIALYRALSRFAIARDELRLLDPNYEKQEKGYFYYYKGTSTATGEVVTGKIHFKELANAEYFEMLRSNKFEYYVDEAGSIIQVGSFQNLLNQLLNNEFGGLFHPSRDWSSQSSVWDPRVMTEKEAVLNAENYRAFCGCFKYVDRPPYIVSLSE